MQEKSPGHTSLAKGVRTVLFGAGASLAVMGGSTSAVNADTTLELSGYVKGDLIYDLDYDMGDEFSASAITIKPRPTTGPLRETETFSAHARQSRIRLVTNTDTDRSPVMTYIEGDFFGGGGNERVSNSSGFRLRHAYGKFGALTVGQTWSNFQNFHYGPTVDFGGPTGQIFIRQAQARLTYGGFSVSIENPEGRIIQGPVTVQATEVDEPIPDFTARFQGGGQQFSYTIAGLVRQFSTDAAPVNDDVFGFGGTLGGTLTLGNTKLMLTGTYGEGIGRYLFGTGGLSGGPSGGAHVNAAANGLEAIEVYAVQVSVSQKFTPTVSGNIVYGRTDLDLPTTLNGIPAFQDQNDFEHSVHTNIMFNPVPQVTYGLEGIWGEREINSGADGDFFRVQFGAKYSF